MNHTTQILAHLFSGFVLYINQLAREKGLRTIYYISREGRFLHDLHLRLDETKNFDLLPAHHIEASRISTFLASLPQDPALEDFERYLWQYGLPDLETFTRGCGLAWPEDPSNWSADYQELATLCKRLPTPEDRLEALLSDEKFRTALSLKIKTRREQLSSYLETLGIFDQQDCMIADIGWAGSIEDNLARAFPDIQWHGAYLYLRPAAQTPPTNSHKHGFLFDGRSPENFALERSMRFVKPLELLTTPAGGSTIGYLQDENSITEPQRQPGSDEQSLKQHWEAIQKRILSAASELPEEFAPDQNMKNAALKQLKNLLHCPPPELAQAYLATPREEEFGHAITHSPISQELSNHRFWGVFKTLSASNWPHAVLVATLTPPWLARIALLLFDFTDSARSHFHRIFSRDYRGKIKER